MQIFSSAGIQRLTDVIPFGLELDNYSGVASEAGLMRLTLALMEQLPGLDDELEKAKAILMASSLPSPVEALNMLREALIDHMLQVARSSEGALRDMLRNGIESFDNMPSSGVLETALEIELIENAGTLVEALGPLLELNSPERILRAYLGLADPSA